MTASLLRSRTAAAIPVLLLGIVVLLDSLPVGHPGTLIVGSIDEPAHLATALLVLLAAGGPSLPLRHRQFFVAAAAAAVLIDIDHLPLYAGMPGISLPGGRPYTHSLATPVALAVLALCFRRRRAVLSGLSVGLLLHFVRDIATGPGLPLRWPFDDRSQTVPYNAYVALLCACAVVATIRLALPQPDLTPTSVALRSQAVPAPSKR